MITRNLFLRDAGISAVVTLLLLISSLAVDSPTANGSTSNFGTLYNFTGGKDGGGPLGSLVLDENHLYGTTNAGGDNETGTVFELTRGHEQDWTERVLYSFGVFRGPDCQNPGGPLIRDKKGNLYGTAIYGGPGQFGCVFQLSPDGYGNWTERVIHYFAGNLAGANPSDAIAMDKAGNLYGSALGGDQTCNGGCGIIYELSPQSNSEWNYRVLYSFRQDATGYYPGGMSLDSTGNLWGGTYQGGSGPFGGAGVVFELVRKEGDLWTYRVIHAFGGPDGTNPAIAPLSFDENGNAFGETATGGGGAGTCWGTVFKISPTDGGHVVKTLYVFRGLQENDGVSPRGKLLEDDRGRLYGTTFFGGPSGGNSMGTVFELTQCGKSWQERLLHSFDFYDGGEPEGGLVTDGNGHFYGTATAGGSIGSGTVFEITSTE